jgi:hypothetical protein
VGSPRLSDEELDAIESFVLAGGGLVVLGETEQEKYGNNLKELLGRFGLHLENDTVQDYEHNLGAPSWILAELGQGGRGREGDLLARVNDACLYRATTIVASNGARVLARTHATASTPGAPLIVATEHGHGHVVVLADSDLFGDDCIDQLDHGALWLNIVFWATRSGGDASPQRDGRGGWRAVNDPAWAALRARVRVPAPRDRRSARMGRRRIRSARLRPLARCIQTRAPARRRARASRVLPDVQAERLA